MSSKVVILGGSGFIGAALLKRLQQEGNLLVEAYNSTTLDLTSPDCVDRLCDMVDDQTILIVTARSRGAQDQLKASSEDIAIATNLAWCLSKQRVKKCLYFSTISVYGDAKTDLSITEETLIGPTSLYGTAKFAGEGMLRLASEKAGIPLVVFRPCMVYGPGDTSVAYGPARFIRSILREGKVRLFGDGSELRDYVFIRDLVKITTRFAFGERRGTYNVATGQSHSFQEIIAFLRKITDQDFEVVRVDRDRAKVDQRINPAKLLGVLPGFRFTELEQGLAETYKYFSIKFAQVGR
jgi:UDP-glucose 4-epimerase